MIDRTLGVQCACVRCSNAVSWTTGRVSLSLLNYNTPTRSLRSANTNLLSVPRVRTTFASRSFSVAAPAVWNSTLAVRDSS